MILKTGFKKAMSKFFLTFIVFAFFNSNYGFALANLDDISINTKYAVAIDSETGMVLYHKNMNEKIYPASTLKLLTALVTVENTNLKDEITASEKVVEGQINNGANVGLMPRETLSVEDALYCLLLPSGNDVAIALAEHIGGTQDKFVDILNKKAKDIGMRNSNFSNSHGLFDANNYSTPYDLALATSYAIKNENIKKIINTDDYTVKSSNFRGDFEIHTTNLMFPKGLAPYKYFIGGKTGYTSESQNNLVSVAEKDGNTYITYLAGNESKLDIALESGKLLDELFDNYKHTKLNSENSHYNISNILKNETISFKRSADLNDTLTLPLNKSWDIKNIKFKIAEQSDKTLLKKGDLIGKLIVKIDKDIIYTKSIYANKNINLPKYILYLFLEIFTFKNLLILISMIFIIVICIKLYNRHRYIKKRNRIKKKLRYRR